MAKTILGIQGLIQMGMRWFAKPPETHLPPSFWLTLSAQGSVGGANVIADKIETWDRLKKASFHDMTNLVRLWVQNNGSTIFVDPETAVLCANTESLETVVCKDIKPSIPFVYFNLPKEVSPSVDGEPYSDCICCYEEKQKRFKAFWFPSNFARSPLPINFYIDEETTVAQQIQAQHEFIEKRAVETGNKLRAMNFENFNKFFELTVNFLLVMQSYPEYVTKIPGERMKFSKNGEPASFILARSKKKNITSAVVEGKESLGGTHDAPYSHWRRGHWRRQPHGDEWQMKNPQAQQMRFEDGRLYHMRWIEPIWVEGLAFTAQD